VLRKERRLRHRRLWYGIASIVVVLFGLSLAINSSKSPILVSATQPTNTIRITTDPISRSPVTEVTEKADILGHLSVSPTVATTTPVVTLIGPTTPADAWANAVLDHLSTLPYSLPSIGSGLAWWQSSVSVQMLGLQDNVAMSGDTPLALPIERDIAISSPQVQNPDELQEIAGIHNKSGALILTTIEKDLPDGQRDWIIGNSDPLVAFRALAAQAAARNQILKIALSTDQDGPVQIVVTNIEPYIVELVTPSTSPAVTSTRIPSPTPTRIPEPAMGRMVASLLDPIVDTLPGIAATAIASYTIDHPWGGLLTWTETGARIGGKNIGIMEATDLTISSLKPDSNKGEPIILLSAQFNGDVTHILEGQVYYQDRRMDEILYWVVVRAAQRGGQLNVTYDDFGSRQVVTILSLIPFQLP
jgi:hypothetical protein